MTNLSEIKSKYLGDALGVTYTVDVNAMRERALETLRDAENSIQNQKDGEKRAVDIDKTWTRRWKRRQQDSIKEQRRAVDLAIKMLGEVSAIIDKAEAKLDEVK
ncbi:MAG: hypothetical protein MJY89_06210 [Bacteroidales bacterium]|nr:hypothetical protein [Bacteroidales bacterium]